jgi:hypothetical protein
LAQSAGSDRQIATHSQLVPVSRFRKSAGSSWLAASCPPGDITIADGDCAALLLDKFAPQVARKAAEHVEWEEFSRMKLSLVATIVAVTRSVPRVRTRRLATSAASFPIRNPS